MKEKKNRKRFDHTGSSFDSFLEEHGIREEVEAVAVNRVLTWELAQAGKHGGKRKKTKSVQ